MSRLPFKKRSSEPADALGVNFEASLKGLVAEFLKSEPFQHALTKGEEREKIVAIFYQDRLPTKYSVVRGQVVDLMENWSSQLDVMIYDSSRNIPFSGIESVVLPAEALLVSVEVKTKLTRDEISKAYKAANKLKSLCPFGREVAYDRKGGEDLELDQCRFFYTLFAYSSDLSEGNWGPEEHQRFQEVANDEGVPVESIDRAYVANRGLIMPSQSRVLPEDDGIALMNFYMHTFNFLERENARRPSVPYIDYAGRMTKGWIDLP